MANEFTGSVPQEEQDSNLDTFAAINLPQDVEGLAVSTNDELSSETDPPVKGKAPAKPVPTANPTVVDPLANIGDSVTGQVQAGKEVNLHINYDDYAPYFAGNPGYISHADGKESLNRARAERQGATEQFLNAAGRVIVNVIPEVVSQLANAADLEDYANADGEVGNWLSKAMTNIQANVDEALPIYRTDPNKPLDIGDSGWWFENGSSLVKSMAAFVGAGYVTGGIAGAGFTKFGQAGKFLTTLGRTTKVGAATEGFLGGAATLTNAIMMNQMESVGIGVDTYEKAYQQALIEIKASDEAPGMESEEIDKKAREIAATKATSAINFNRANILLNLTSASMFMKTPMNTRTLVKPLSKLTTAKSIVGEGTQEYIEENINNIAQEQALAEKYSFKDAMASVMSAEGLESGLLGFIGGAGQTALTKAGKAIPMYKNTAYNEAYTNAYNSYADTNLSAEEKDANAKKEAYEKTGNNNKRISDNDRRNARYVQQQSALNTWNEMSGVDKIKDATNVFSMAQETVRLQAEIGVARKAGELAKADTLSKRLFANQLQNAFDTGTVEGFIELYKGYGKLSKEEAESKGIYKEGDENTPDYYVTKANKAIKDIEALERIYNESSTYLNSNEVYDLESQRYLNDDTLADLKAKIASEFKTGEDRYKGTSFNVGKEGKHMDPDNPTGYDINRVNFGFKRTPEYRKIKSWTKAFDTINEYNTNMKGHINLITTNEYQNGLKDAIRRHRENQKKEERKKENKGIRAEKKRTVNQVIDNLKKNVASKKVEELRTDEKVEEIKTNPVVDDVVPSPLSETVEEIPTVKPAETTAPEIGRTMPDAGTDFKYTPFANGQLTPLMESVKSTVSNKGISIEESLAYVDKVRKQFEDNSEALLQSSILTAEEKDRAIDELNNLLDELKDKLVNKSGKFDNVARMQQELMDEIIEELAPATTPDFNKNIERAKKLAKILEEMAKIGVDVNNFKDVIVSFENGTSKDEVLKAFNVLKNLFNLANGTNIEGTYDELILGTGRQQSTIQMANNIAKFHKPTDTYDYELDNISIEAIQSLNDMAKLQGLNAEGNGMSFDIYNETASNKVAYLARLYNTAFSEQRSDTGKPFIEVTKEDVDNLLNAMLDQRMLDPEFIKVGDKVTFVPLKSVTLEDGSIREAANSTPENSPIGIEINDELMEGAYLHDVSWINETNLTNTKEGILADQNTLLALRKLILNSNTPITTTVTNRTPGVPIMDASGALSRVVDATPDLEIAITKDGKLYTDRDTVIETANLTTFHEGVGSIIIPFGNKNLALPVRRAQLNEEQVTSIIEATRLNALGKINETVKQIDSQYGINILTARGLEQYINQFINLSKMDVNNLNEYSDALADLPDTTSLVQFTGGRLMYGSGQSIFMNEMYPSKYTNNESALNDDLQHFGEHLERMYTHINLDLLKSNTNPKIAYINSDGEVSSPFSDYKTFVKSNLLSPYMGITLDSGKTIYTIQGKMHFDMKQAFSTEKVNNVVQNNVDTQSTIIEPKVGNTVYMDGKPAVIKSINTANGTFQTENYGSGYIEEVFYTEATQRVLKDVTVVGNSTQNVTAPQLQRKIENFDSTVLIGDVLEKKEAIKSELDKLYLPNDGLHNNTIDYLKTSLDGLESLNSGQLQPFIDAYLDKGNYTGTKVENIELFYDSKSKRLKGEVTISEGGRLIKEQIRQFLKTTKPSSEEFTNLAIEAPRQVLPTTPITLANGKVYDPSLDTDLDFSPATVDDNQFKGLLEGSNIIDGLSIGTQTAIIKSIANDIAMEFVDKDSGTVNVGQQVEIAIQGFEQIRDLHINSSSPRAELLSTQVAVIRDNKAKITRAVDLEFKKFRNVQKAIDLADDNDNVELRVEKDEVSERLDITEYTVDPRTGLTAQVKQFLENITEKVIVRTGEDVEYRTRQIPLGINSYVPFDIVFNDLVTILSKSNVNANTVLPTINEKYGQQSTPVIHALEQIEKHVPTRPYLIDVIEKLKDAEPHIQNQFLSALNLSHTNHLTLQTSWNKEEKSWTIRSNESASKNVTNLVLSDWQNALKYSPIIGTKGDVAVVKPAAIKYFKEKYAEMVNAEGNPFYGDLNHWLALIGVEIPSDLYDQMNTVGLRLPDGSVQGLKQSLTLPGGIFKNIYDRVSKFDLDSTNPLDLDTNNLYEDSAFRDLAHIISYYKKDIFNHSHKNSNGDTIYGFSGNKYVVDRALKLISDVKLLQNLSRTVFSRSSTWLNELLSVNGEGVSIKESVFKKYFKYYTIDGMKTKDNQTGKTLDALTPTELSRFHLGLFYNRGLKVGKGTTGTPIMKVMYQTMSDKSTGFAFQVAGRFFTMSATGGLRDTDKQYLVDTLIKPEMERIYAYQANPDAVDIKEYKQGAGKFLLFPDLNNMEDLWEDGLLKSEAILADKMNAIQNKMYAYIYDMVIKQKETWKEQGIIREDKDGNDSLTYMDKSYKKNFGLGGITIEEKTIAMNTVAMNYVINTTIASMNFHQLFIGDPALYYKGGKDGLTFAEATSDNLGKRLAGDNAGKKQLVHEPGETFGLLVIADTYNDSTVSSYIKKLYKNQPEQYSQYMKGVNGSKGINSADAQEYTSLKEHLNYMFKEGKLSLNDRDSIMTYYNKTGKIPTMAKKLILSANKPVYVNNFLRGSGEHLVDARLYVKSSSIPLIKEFTEGTPLDKLREFIENPDNGVDRVAFESAVKVGMPSRLINIFTENGDVVIPEKWQHSALLNVPREGHGTQNEVPYSETSNTVNDGTQQSKELFTNILDVEGFIHPETGEKVNGRQLAEVYHGKYQEMFEKKYNNLIQKLAFNPKTGVIKNINYLRNLLEKEGLSRNYSSNDIASLEVDELADKFTVPLWLNNADSKIVSLLNSIVDNQIRKRKFRGKSFVLASNAGLKGIGSIDSSKVIRVGNWDGTLKGAENKEGKMTYAEILIPFKFWDNDGNLLKVEDFMVDGKIDLNRLPEKALEIYGYRIPTSGINLSSNIKVVGFLPSNYGDIVIAPDDFIVQMGSDFDVDKLYTHMYNTVYNSETKTISVVDRELINRKERLSKSIAVMNARIAELEYNLNSAVDNATANALKEQVRIFKETDYMLIEDLDIQLLQNDLLDIHKAILNNPNEDVQRARVKPLSFGELPDLAKLINKVNTNRYFTPLSNMYQQFKYMNARAGKTAVGIFSLDLVFNSVSQFIDYKKAPMNFTELVREGENLVKKTLSYDIAGFKTTALNNPRLSDGSYKSEIFEAFMAAALDNEKEQLLGKLNINANTFDFIRASNQLGFPAGLTISIINQPSVLKYIKDKSNGIYADATVLTELHRAMLQTTSIDDLLNYVGTSDVTNEIQQASLALFHELSNKGKELKTVQSAINSDSSGIGKNMFYSLRKTAQILNLPNSTSITNASRLIGIYDNLNENPAFLQMSKPDADKYIKDALANGYLLHENVLIKPTSLGGFAGLYGTVFNTQLWASFYPYTQDGMSEILTSIQAGKVNRRTSIADEAKEMQDSVTGFKSLLISDQFDLVSQYDSIQDARKDLLFDTETHMSLPAIVFDLKESNTFSNQLLDKLQTGKANGVVNLNGYLPTELMYVNAGTIEMDEEITTNAFIDMIVNDRPLKEYNGKMLTSRELANKLITHQLITGGIQKSTQFIKYIPYKYLKQLGYYKSLERLSNVTNPYHTTHMKDVYYTQTVQHFPENYYDENLVGMVKNISKGILTINDPDDIKPKFVIVPVEKSEKYSIYKRAPQGTHYIEIDNLGYKGIMEFDMNATFAAESNINMNRVANRNIVEITNDIPVTVAPVQLTEEEIETGSQETNEAFSETSTETVSEQGIDDGYKYFGKNYTIVIENGRGVDVQGYKGKLAAKQKLLEAFNSNPDVDPQNGKQFRNFTTTITPRPEVVSSRVYNAEQTEAIRLAVDFIKNGNPNEIFTLGGKAGTGKTTVASEIIRQFPRNSVAVAALSHKAKNVIKTKFIQDKVRATYYSLAGLLGQGMDLETGRFERKADDFLPPPVSNNDIIVIDEGSMINEEGLELIMSLKAPDSKVIFLGDIGQLPPIRTVENPYYADKQYLFDKPSPVFDSKNTYSLQERVRQGEESPILPFADRYWNASQGILNPEKANRDNIITQKGALLFTNSIKDIKDQVIKAFQMAVTNGNPNLIKVVTYTNNARETTNDMIHNALFDNKLFNKGELIIFNSNYGEEIENSAEAQITNASEEYTDSENPTIKYQVLSASINDTLETFPVLSKDSKRAYEAVVSQKFKDAFALKGKDHRAYVQALRNAWAAKNKYANVDFGYAITSHKSQGSTYDMVIVDERDIMSVKPTSITSKAQSIYTGITRAKNVTAVLSVRQLPGEEFPDLVDLNNNIELAKVEGTPIVAQDDVEVIPSPEETRDFLSIDRDTSEDLSPSTFNTDASDYISKYSLADNTIPVEEKYKVLLTEIADNNSDPILKHFAKELLTITPALSNIPLFIDTRLKAKGVTVSSQRTGESFQIKINPNLIHSSNELDRVLIEEIMHATTKRFTVDGNNTFTKNINSIRLEMKDALIAKYGQGAYDEMERKVSARLPLNKIENELLYNVSNNQEFITGAIKSKAFQEFLNGTEATYASKSLFEKFIDAVKQLLVTLGVRQDTNLGAVLHEVINLFEDVRSQNTLDAVTVPQYYRTKDYLNTRFNLVDKANNLLVKGNPKEIADFINRNIVNITATVNGGHVELESNTLKDVVSDFSFMVEEDFTKPSGKSGESPIAGNLANYKKSLEIRVNRLTKSVNKAKADKNFDRLISLEQDLREEKTKLSTLNKIPSVRDLADKGREDLDKIKDMLRRPLSDEDIVYARHTINFWRRAKDLIFDDRLNESPVLRKEYGDIEGIAENYSNKLLLIEKRNQEEKIKENGRNISLDTEFERFKDINSVQGLVRDISMYDNALLHDIWTRVKRANLDSTDEANNLLEGLDELTQKVIPILKGLGYDEVFEIFRQKTARGKYNGHMVGPYTNAFHKTMSKEKQEARKNDNRAGLIKYMNWLNKNAVNVELKKVFPDDGVITPEVIESRNALKEKLGEGIYNNWFTNQERKLFYYENRKQGFVNMLVAQHNLSKAEDINDTPAALKAFNTWVDRNSPYMLETNAFNAGMTIKADDGFESPNYYEVVPSNDKDFDENFTVIANDATLLEFYNRISNLFKDLKKYVPDAQQRTLAYGGIPFIEKSIIEQYSGQIMQQGVTPIRDAFAKSIQTSLGSSVANIDPTDNSTIKDLRIPIIKDTYREVRDIVDFKSAEYVTKNGKQPSIDLLKEFEEDAIDEISQKKSFDLGKIAKVYTSLVMAHKHKAKIEDGLKIAKTVLNSYNERQLKPDGTVATMINSGRIAVKDKQQSFLKAKAALDYFEGNVMYGEIHDEEGKLAKKYTKTERNKKAEIAGLLQELEETYQAGDMEADLYNSTKSSLMEQDAKLGKTGIASKYGDNVLKYIQLKLMGWNVLGGISNMGFGAISNYIEASGGQLFTKADLSYAYRLTLNSVAKNASFNGFATPMAQKIRNAMDKMDVLKDASHELYTSSTPNSFNKKLQWLKPYNANQRTEYMNQAPIMIAIARNTKVQTPNGEVSLWDGFDKDWNWNTTKYGEVPTDVIKKFRLKLDQLNKRTHGNYDNLSPLAIKKTFLGRAGSQFRTWLYESVATRIEEERYDPTLDITVKGRYRSVGSVFSDANPANLALETLKGLMTSITWGAYKGGDFKGLTKKDGSAAKEIDMINMRKVMMEVSLAIDLYLFVLLLSMIGGDDDDDALNILINQGTRLKTDLMLYVNPMEARNILRDLIPAVSIVKDTSDWMGAVGQFATGNDEIESGVHEGDSRLGSATLKNLPFGSKAYSVYNSGSQVFDKD